MSNYNRWGNDYVRNKGHVLYVTWKQMRQRCTNTNCKAFPDYGGRGISICDEWSDFKNFVSDMFPSYKAGLSIDRIDNDGHYSKENCRWATPKEQAINRRNTRLISYDGKSMTLADWGRFLGKNKSTLTQRYYTYKWSVERLLTT